jgi:hypothetical protein
MESGNINFGETSTERRKEFLSPRCVYCLPKKLILLSQKNFITGTRSLNEEDLHKNLTYFKVPPAGIESIRSKLVFKIFIECLVQDSTGVPKTVIRRTPSQSSPCSPPSPPSEH